MSRPWRIDFKGALYHVLYILLRANSPNLSKAMQWIGVTYTRRFNNRHVRSGHLFQGRFKNIIVQAENPNHSVPIWDQGPASEKPTRPGFVS